MPTPDRRTVLTSLSTLTLISLAGCSFLPSERLPAGSLVFENQHDLPHLITAQVTGVGAEPGEEPESPQGDVIVPPSQRSLSASTVLKPGERQTYKSVFTESVWYSVRFTVDNREPANDAGVITFNPAPRDRAYGTFLSGSVYQSGEFSWVVSGTKNAGSFEFGTTTTGT